MMPATKAPRRLDDVMLPPAEFEVRIVHHAALEPEARASVSPHRNGWRRKTGEQPSPHRAGRRCTAYERQLGSLSEREPSQSAFPCRDGIHAVLGEGAGIWTGQLLGTPTAEEFPRATKLQQHVRWQRGLVRAQSSPQLQRPQRTVSLSSFPPLTENPGTCVAPKVRVLHTPDLRRQFIYLYPRLRPLLIASDPPGFLLACVAPDGTLSWAMLPINLGQSSHRTVGRHSDCDLRLSGNPTLSLRHLLVSAWLEDGFRPKLRILDLGGGVPLRLEDDSLCAGLQADGTILASLGHHSLLFVFDDGDRWPKDPEEAWERLGSRDARVRDIEGRDGAFERTVRPQIRLLPNPKIQSGSSVTATGTEVVHLDRTAELADLPADGSEAIGFLRLPGDRFVRLTPADLSRGVLIGRYDRCELGRSCFSDSPTVSRVHLCLALDPTGLWAIDTSSTNGTWVDDEQIKAIRIGERAQLLLGTEVLGWQLHRS